MSTTEIVEKANREAGRKAQALFDEHKATGCSAFIKLDTDFTGKRPQVAYCPSCKWKKVVE